MEKEFVSFKFDGDEHEYKLCYDFNQLVAAEEETGCNLLAAFLGDGMNAKAFRALLYACLKTAHPEVLLREAGVLASRDLDIVMAALGKLLSRNVTSVPQPDPGAVAEA